MSSNQEKGKFYEKSITCTQDNRLASVSEQVYLQLGDANIFNFIQTTVFTLKANVPMEKVRQALWELSTDHFLLQAKVDHLKSGDKVFQKMENTFENDDWIVLKTANAKHSNEWPEIAAKDAAIPFDTAKGPLWRVNWVECESNSSDEEHTYVMIFVCSHAIIDAKGSFDLIANQFLPILNGILDKKPFVRTEKPIFFAEPNESIFSSEPFHYSQSECQSPWYIKLPVYIGLKLFDIFGSKSPDLKVYSEEKTDGKFGMFHPFSIDVGNTHGLIAVCKNQGVSVHSVLMMILGYSLKSLEKDYEHLKLKFNSIQYPIDYRKFNKNLYANPQPLGVYHGTDGQKIRFIDPKDTGNFFQFCESLTQKIRNGNRPKEASGFVFVINELIKNNRLEDIVKLAPVNLSNLGKCDLVKSNLNDVVRLNDQYFGIVVKDIVAVTCTTVNEKMYFCICYDGRWLSTGFITDLARVMKESIIAVAR